MKRNITQAKRQISITKELRSLIKILTFTLSGIIGAMKLRKNINFQSDYMMQFHANKSYDN